MTNSSYYVGVDLGQARDATAIAIVHSYREVLQVRNRVTMEFGTKEWLVLRQVERVRLGTDYTTVVARVGQVVRALTGLGKVTVAPDGTGVGRPRRTSAARGERPRPGGGHVAEGGAAGGDCAGDHYGRAWAGRITWLPDGGEEGFDPWIEHAGGERRVEFRGRYAGERDAAGGDGEDEPEDFIG